MSANVNNIFDSCNDSCEKYTSKANEIANITSLSYNGRNVSFDNFDEIMINATEMGNIFGKSPRDFLRTDFAKRYIDKICEKQKCH